MLPNMRLNVAGAHEQGRIVLPRPSTPSTAPPAPAGGSPQPKCDPLGRRRERGYWTIRATGARSRSVTNRISHSIGLERNRAMTTRSVLVGLVLAAACHAAGAVRDTSSPNPDPHGLQHHFFWDFHCRFGPAAEIGRASCRESGETRVGAL